MKWRGRRQSENVIDRRTQRVTPARAGAGGVGALLVVGFAMYMLGADPQAIVATLQNELQMSASSPMQLPQSAISSYDSEDTKGLVSATLASLEDHWSEIFRRGNSSYRPAPLVLFRGGTNTGCGFGDTAAGPFYCPADHTVYLDLNFMEELVKLGGRGDFGLAYVVAHEIGHHVQTLLEPNRMRARKGNQESVATELQADCYAGVWAHYANNQRDFLEPGDIEEGLKTAAAVGDDHIQRTVTGHVRPESFTHGSSEQRVQAFNVGFRTGRTEACAFRE
jgi:predicted metalloprotease